MNLVGIRAPWAELSRTLGMWLSACVRRGERRRGWRCGIKITPHLVPHARVGLELLVGKRPAHVSEHLLLVRQLAPRRNAAPRARRREPGPHSPAPSQRRASFSGSRAATCAFVSVSVPVALATPRSSRFRILGIHTTVVTTLRGTAPARATSPAPRPAWVRAKRPVRIAWLPARSRQD